MFCKKKISPFQTYIFLLYLFIILATDANFIGTTDKGLLVHVPTLVYKTQPTTEMDDTSDKQNDDNSNNDKSLDTSHLLLIVNRHPIISIVSSHLSCRYCHRCLSSKQPIKEKTRKCTKKKVDGIAW